MAGGVFSSKGTIKVYRQRSPVTSVHGPDERHTAGGIEGPDNVRKIADDSLKNEHVYDTQ